MVVRWRRKKLADQQPPRWTSINGYYEKFEELQADGWQLLGWNERWIGIGIAIGIAIANSYEFAIKHYCIIMMNII